MPKYMSLLRTRTRKSKTSISKMPITRIRNQNRTMSIPMSLNMLIDPAMCFIRLKYFRWTLNKILKEQSQNIFKTSFDPNLLEISAVHSDPTRSRISKVFQLAIEMDLTLFQSLRISRKLPMPATF